MTDLQEIKHDQKDIKDDLKRLLFYVENDPKTGRKGIVTDVEDLKNSQDGLRKTMVDFISDYRQDQAVKRAKIGVIGMIGGTLGTGLWWLFTHFFK